MFKGAGNGGVFVTVPFDLEAVFGKKRVRAKATVAGMPNLGSFACMGTGDHLLIVLKEIREQVGVPFGDEIETTVEEDTQPQVVVILEDM